MPFSFGLVLSHTPLVAHTVKNLPAMQGTLGCEDLLEKGMANDSMWKIPKEMEIQDHLTVLLRNLYAGQEATVRTRHGTMD